MCLIMCALRLLNCAKALPQCSHRNGFSPVWVRTCKVGLDFCANSFSQQVHLNGPSSPVCTRIWFDKELCVLKLFLQMKHTKEWGNIAQFQPKLYDIEKKGKDQCIYAKAVQSLCRMIKTF